MNSKALLVSKLSPAVDALKGLLAEIDYSAECVVSDAKTALDVVDDTIYDIVIINAPLEDENGIDLAVKISTNTVCGVILLVQSDKASLVGKKVIDYGVVVVSKPINKMIFKQSLGVVRAAQKRYAGLSKENERLKSSLEEAKILNRAKFLLMQYLSLSEERAHKYIEKQAMDMRISRIEVAKQILRTYASNS